MTAMTHHYSQANTTTLDTDDYPTYPEKDTPSIEIVFSVKDLEVS